MRRLHPATILVAIGPALRGVLFQLGPILLFGLFRGKRDAGDGFELFLAAIGGLTALSSVSTYLTSQFGIVEGAFVFRTGWIFRKDRRLPLDQIQSVNIRGTPLMRLLQVASFGIETAAGAGAEVSLSVLSEENAEALRRELGRALAMTDAVAPGTEESRPLPLRELAIVALGENNAGAIVLPLVGLFGTAGSQVALTGVFGVMEPWVRWLIGVAVFVGLALAGWLLGIGSFLLKYGGFRLTRSAESFRVEYGLLNKTAIILRRTRIESVTVTRTALQRRIGRCTVKAATAGSFGEAGADAPLALGIPFAQVDDWTAEVAPLDPLTSLVFRRFSRRTLVASVVVTLALAAGTLWGWKVGFSFFGLNENLFGLRVMKMLLFVPVGLALLGLIEQGLAFRRSGIALGRGVVAVRTGWLQETTTLIPLERVEVMQLEQPPLWRRYRLWNGSVQAMVRSVAFRGVEERTVAELRRRLDAPTTSEHAMVTQN